MFASFCDCSDFCTANDFSSSKGLKASKLIFVLLGSRMLGLNYLLPRLDTLKKIRSQLKIAVTIVVIATHKDDNSSLLCLNWAQCSEQSILLKFILP